MPCIRVKALRELNWPSLSKDGKSYKIKKQKKQKQKDSVAGQVNCFPCTDNYWNNASQDSANTLITPNDLYIMCLFTNQRSEYC